MYSFFYFCFRWDFIMMRSCQPLNVNWPSCKQTCSRNRSVWRQSLQRKWQLWPHRKRKLTDCENKTKNCWLTLRLQNYLQQWWTRIGIWTPPALKTAHPSRASRTSQPRSRSSLDCLYKTSTPSTSTPLPKRITFQIVHLYFQSQNVHPLHLQLPHHHQLRHRSVRSHPCPAVPELTGNFKNPECLRHLP